MNDTGTGSVNYRENCKDGVRVGTLEFLKRLSDCPLKWQHNLTTPGGSTKGSPLET
jgi:hypothetical protein